MMKKLVTYFFMMSCCIRPEAQQLYLDITVNDQPDVAIYPEQPVLLRITLSNPAAGYALADNLAIGRRIRELEDSLLKNPRNREIFNKEKDALNLAVGKPDTIRLGTTADPWYNKLVILVTDADGKPVTLPFKRMALPKTEEQLQLDAYQQGSIAYGLDPNMLTTSLPGKYYIRVRVGNTVSRSVCLTLKNAPVPSADLSSPAILLQAGNYYIQAGEPLRALFFADMLLQIVPQSLPAHTLKGDAYFYDGKKEMAREWYQLAYQHYFRVYGNNAEPPAYLLMMLSLLQ